MIRMTSDEILDWLFDLTGQTSNDAWICEIGTLYGSVTSKLGLACVSSNRRVVTIDHMIGGHCMDMKTRAKCVYLDFIDNMIDLGIWDKIIPFPMKSYSLLDFSIYEHHVEIPEDVRDTQYLQASDMLLLMGAEFELIYIDGNHTYKNVLSELKLYSKMLKPGGIICGDDCNAEQRPFLDSFLHHQEYFETVLAVAKAVLEFFNGNNEFEPIEVPVNQFGFRRLK